MKIVNDMGIVLISLYYIFLGAYYVLYAKILYTAAGLVTCYGTECMMLIFLKMVCFVFGIIGFVYVLLAVVIRFHRFGVNLILITSAFNIVLMVIYLLKPMMFSLWITFVFPIRVVLTRSLEYVPVQGDWASMLESGFEIFMILLNIGIAAYLIMCTRREVWGPEEKKDEEEDGEEEDEEMTSEEFVKAVRESFKKK
jgi:hypothetical protein